MICKQSRSCQPFKGWLTLSPIENDSERDERARDELNRLIIALQGHVCLSGFRRHAGGVRSQPDEPGAFEPHQADAHTLNL